MNAHIDQLNSHGSFKGPFSNSSAVAAGFTTVDLPSQRKTWFNHYDEEWAAFLTESSMKKSRPGINNEVPETLPRVWNSPS